MSFNYQEVAEQFVALYYKQFETKETRGQLGQLYRAESMLTFETNQVQGAQAIVEKLASLPFQKVRHEIATRDAQPGSPGGSDIVVMVTGQLLIDDEANPQRYSQFFHLVQDGNTYYVFNDIFRLL